MSDELRALKERIYELEKQNAEMERAVNRALSISSFDEAKRLLRRAVSPYRSRWTAELLLDKLHEWVQVYDRTPAALDWNPSQARKYKMYDRAEAFFAGEWPGVSTVLGHFDSWNAFIAAGGYEPRAPGETHAGPTPGGAREDKLGHLPPWNGWEFLRGYRERMGLTQDQLTVLTGLSHNYLTAIERGHQTNPSVRIILAIAKPLGVRPGAFFE